MQMILIAGQAGVGKSTLAKFIAEEAFKKGLTPVLLSFASPLKDDAKKKGYGKEVNPKKYREYCQEIGAAMRKGNPDYWVLKFNDYVKAVQKEERNAVKQDLKYWERVIIVDDARYINELAYGTLFDASSIFISSKDRNDLDLTAEWRNHESEQLAKAIDNGAAGNVLKKFTNIVFNDEGIEGLRDVAKELTPVWCGLTADNYCSDTNVCTCNKCKGITNKDIPNLQDILNNLCDLLFLSDPDKDIEDDEEDEYEDS